MRSTPQREGTKAIQPTLSESDKQKLAALYQSGLPTSALVKRFGVTAWTITHKILPKYNVTPRMGRPRLT